ncbi:MAG: 16S rRNA (guanine(966)-N(2))-methyltransferase RsmD [Hyphomicrobiaceae bacterium]|nr:16S rRNA (guanine(966)-N(2))-methyltransferase RsmD [Hyphomicrobiaceae bacterium]
MRIVGGRFRGRAIAAPSHAGLRPTADRVRESIFNILLHGVEGLEVEGARVIDLFAGTGALGLEALSRGAAYCLFVEEAVEARALIRSNVEAMGLMGVTKIYRRDATSLGPAAPHQPFDLAFLDPPYGQGLAEKALEALIEGGWLKAGAIAVVEERATETVWLPQGFAEIDRRAYGDTQVVFARFDI